MSGRVIPLRRRGTAPPEPGRFEEVARARDQAEALVIKGLLEAHGIQVLLRTRLAPSVHPFTVGDQAEVRVLVPHDALATGRRLLSRGRAPRAER